jgi:hypothetical protein
MITTKTTDEIVEVTNFCFKLAGCGAQTNVEWDDCTEQFLLSVDKADFKDFDLIQTMLKSLDLHTDEFLNGHGYIRPASAARQMDLALERWDYTLIQHN